MKIAGRKIANNAMPYIVAEISGEHKGSYDNMINLIDSAQWAGADAVKFQLFHPKKLAKLRGGENKKLKNGPWKNIPLLKLYNETVTPKAWFPLLDDYCRKNKITWFTSIFDVEDLDFLESLGCPAYKVSNYENAHINLIEDCLQTGKPVVRSYDNALTMSDCINLYCKSIYPCPLEDLELCRMKSHMHLSISPTGLSDHTTGIIAAVAATAYGAAMIEKHITLSNTDGGWDRSFSLEPENFKLMVNAIHQAHEAVQIGV